MINRIKTILVFCLAAAFMAVSCEEPKVNVTGIQIIPVEKTLNIGESFDVMVMVTPDNATDARYVLSVDDPAVISLDANKVTALAAGETNVVATAQDGGLTATCKVTVRKEEEPGPGPGPGPDDDSVKVTGVTVNPTSKSLKVGETVQLEVTVSPEDATNPNYTLKADSDVITIAGDVVTAVKVGTANVTVTTEDGGFTASCVIIVEEEDVPDPGNGGNGKADGYTMTILDLMHNDIYISVDAPADASEYFIWAEKESVVSSFTDQELIDYTTTTVYNELKTALNYTRIDSVLGEQGYRGDRAKISVANACTAYKLGGEAVVLRTIEPETRYVVYGFGVNFKTGEATSGVFKLTTATVAAKTSDEIILKGTAANNIIVDINVLDEEMPYFLFFRKSSEVAGLSDDEIYQKDLKEDLNPAANSYGMSLADYVKLAAMRGNVKGYNILGNAYLDPETDYTVYFYGFDETAAKSTPVYKVEATTDAVVPSGVTFEVSSEKDSKGKIVNLKVVPSDESAAYVLHPVLESMWGDYVEGEDPGVTVKKSYINGLIGAVHSMDGYSMTIEKYLLGDGVQDGVCQQGTYNDVVNNLLYGAGDTLHIVAFTVDPKTGVITSDPKVIAELQ